MSHVQVCYPNDPHALSAPTCSFLNKSSNMRLYTIEALEKDIEATKEKDNAKARGLYIAWIIVLLITMGISFIAPVCMLFGVSVWIPGIVSVIGIIVSMSVAGVIDRKRTSILERTKVADAYKQHLENLSYKLRSTTITLNKDPNKDELKGYRRYQEIGKYLGRKGSALDDVEWMSNIDARLGIDSDIHLRRHQAELSNAPGIDNMQKVQSEVASLKRSQQADVAFKVRALSERELESYGCRLKLIPTSDIEHQASQYVSFCRSSIQRFVDLECAFDKYDQTFAGFEFAFEISPEILQKREQCKSVCMRLDTLVLLFEKATKLGATADKYRVLDKAKYQEIKDQADKMRIDVMIQLDSSRITAISEVLLQEADEIGRHLEVKLHNHPERQMQMLKANISKMQDYLKSPTWGLLWGNKDDVLLKAHKQQVQNEINNLKVRFARLEVKYNGFLSGLWKTWMHSYLKEEISKAKKVPYANMGYLAVLEKKLEELNSVQEKVEGSGKLIVSKDRMKKALDVLCNEIVEIDTAIVRVNYLVTEEGVSKKEQIFKSMTSSARSIYDRNADMYKRSSEWEKTQTCADIGSEVKAQPEISEKEARDDLCRNMKQLEKKLNEVKFAFDADQEALVPKLINETRELIKEISGESLSKCRSVLNAKLADIRSKSNEDVTLDDGINENLSAEENDLIRESSKVKSDVIERLNRILDNITASIDKSLSRSFIASQVIGIIISISTTILVILLLSVSSIWWMPLLLQAVMLVSSASFILPRYFMNKKLEKIETNERIRNILLHAKVFKSDLGDNKDLDRLHTLSDWLVEPTAVAVTNAKSLSSGKVEFDKSITKRQDGPGRDHAPRQCSALDEAIRQEAMHADKLDKLNQHADDLLDRIKLIKDKQRVATLKENNAAKLDNELEKESALLKQERLQGLRSELMLSLIYGEAGSETLKQELSPAEKQEAMIIATRLLILHDKENEDPNSAAQPGIPPTSVDDSAASPVAPVVYSVQDQIKNLLKEAIAKGLLVAVKSILDDKATLESTVMVSRASAVFSEAYRQEQLTGFKDLGDLKQSLEGIGKAIAENINLVDSEKSPDESSVVKFLILLESLEDKFKKSLQEETITAKSDDVIDEVNILKAMLKSTRSVSNQNEVDSSVKQNKILHVSKKVLSTMMYLAEKRLNAKKAKGASLLEILSNLDPLNVDQSTKDKLAALLSKENKDSLMALSCVFARNKCLYNQHAVAVADLKNQKDICYIDCENFNDKYQNALSLELEQLNKEFKQTLSDIDTCKSFKLAAKEHLAEMSQREIEAAKATE